MTVHYSENGQSKKTYLLSFKVPALTDFLKSTPKGSVIEVETEKNGEYVNWIGAKLGDQAAPQATKSFAAPKSTYETPEERAYRQVLIVRQSCLAQSVAFHAKMAESMQEDILNTADMFVEWVFSDAEDEPENNLDA